MEVLDRRAEFTQYGVQIVAVSMCAPPILRMYLKMKPCPVPVVCDPERKAYAALGLGQIRVWRLFRPDVLFKFLGQIARGHKVRRMYPGEDALQAGGDFLVTPNRIVLWAHQGEDPTDRPTAQQILTAVRAHLVDAAPPISY